jgi:hypothetical protein
VVAGTERAPAKRTGTSSSPSPRLSLRSGLPSARMPSDMSSSSRSAPQPWMIMPAHPLRTAAQVATQQRVAASRPVDDEHASRRGARRLP